MHIYDSAGLYRQQKVAIVVFSCNVSAQDAYIYLTVPACLCCKIKASVECPDHTVDLYYP